MARSGSSSSLAPAGDPYLGKARRYDSDLTESIICRRGKHLFERNAALDMEKQFQRPDRDGTHLPGGHVPPDARRETTKEKVPRPDRVEKVPMTTQVEPELRLFYKIWAPQLGINMQDMQDVALTLIKARLESVPERERLALWGVIKKEAASANEVGA